MRRFPVVLLLTLGVSFLTVTVWAQERNPLQNGVPLVILTNPLNPMLEVAGQPVELERLGSFPEPASLTAAPATDSCSGAPSLALFVGGGGDGGVTQVSGMSESVTDPVASCAWGGPKKGYRTVWYKFQASSNGRVTIDTRGSNYDTILSVHTGGCGALVTLACNDDNQGFSSKVSFTVIKDQIYYVEVADWHFNPPPGGASLSLFAWMDQINSKWKPIVISGIPALSRHATVTVGNDIYVIGGQTVMGNPPATPPTISEEIYRFETDTGKWVDPTQMIGPRYANTTAAYVDGRIYLPSGYAGNNTSFDGHHWAFDVAGSFWMTRTTAPWPNGQPIAWAAAVANPAENGYYLVGGLSSQPPFDENVQVHDEVFFYSTLSNSWITSTLPVMNDPRYAHTGALVNGRVCVAGGLKAGTATPPTPNPNILLRNGECYTPGSGAWTLTGDMKYPRYLAGSAAGPDGKWYVFGGIDGLGKTVPVTEVYDPATNNWTALDVTFDLGAGANWPARAWPRGGFVGSTLWVIGGNNSSSQTLSLIDKLFVSSHDVMLPVVARGMNIEDIPDDTFASARLLTLNQAKLSNFNNLLDFYDMYRFDLSSQTAVTINLTRIPAHSNYDIAVYDDNKQLWGRGKELLNTPESVKLTLSAGRYYVVVERVFPGGDPNPANYQIIVQD